MSLNSKFLLALVAFFLVTAGIVIYTTLKKKKRNKKERERDEREEFVDAQEQKYLKDYIPELVSANKAVWNQKVSVLVDGIISELKTLQNIEKINPSSVSHIERFANKYLPTLIDSVERYGKIPANKTDIYSEAESKLISTLILIKDALLNMIQRYSEPKASPGVEKD